MHPASPLIRSLLLLVLTTTGCWVFAQQGKEAAIPSDLQVPSTEATKTPDGDTLTVLPEIDSQLFSAGELIDTTEIATDTLPVVDTTRRDTLIEVQHALRVGIDLAAPLLPIISGKNEDRGWMMMVDYRLTPKLYAAANFGMAKRHLNFTSMRTSVDGWFAQAGVHYALTQGAFLQKNGKEGLDILYLGAKLGYSKYNRHIYDLTISDGYWGTDYAVDITDHPSAMWLNLSIGAEVSLWNNLFLSVEGSYNLIVAQSDGSGIGPLAVPGIGQVYNKSVAFSMSYGIAYRFPLYKKMHRIRIRQKRESENERRAREDAEKKTKFTPVFTPTELLEE